MTAEEVVNKTSIIFSSVWDEEIETWYKYLVDNKGIRIVVDIGTGWGKSANALGLICPQAMVYTFDPGDYYVDNNQAKDYEDYARIVKDNIRRVGCKNIEFHVGHSLDEWLPPLPIDALNFDSEWRDKELTVKELRRWLPLVKKDGLIFIHSYWHYKVDCIPKACEEVLPELGVELLDEVDCRKQYHVGVFKKL
jgi:predicted O-methyltransferase YrrM